MRIVFDAATSKSARRIDDNGFLHVTGCPITSAGVFDYGRSECELPGDPNEIVKVLRSLDVIRDQAFILSCQNLPIIDNHTYVEGVTVDSEGFSDEEGVDPDKKGVCGTMTNFRFDDASQWCVADLVFYSRTMIRLIQAGKKVELSLGYTSVFEPTQEGSEYAAEQTTMRGNHLALVDRARVQGARVLDSAFIPQSSEDKPMKKKTGDSAVDKLRELIPALAEFLKQESAEPAHAGGDEGETDEAAAEEAAAAAAAAAEENVDPAAKPAAAVPEASDDDEIKSLLEQLIAALAGKPAGDEQVDGVDATAAGDEEPTEKTETGDGDDDEQIAARGAATMDSMFAAVAERDKLYGRLSKHVGAFDHAAMSPAAVADYGVKRLGIKVKAGDSAAAVLGAYLDGAEAAARKMSEAAKATKRVGDSAAPHSDELSAYLAGNGK